MKIDEIKVGQEYAYDEHAYRGHASSNYRVVKVTAIEKFEVPGWGESKLRREVVFEVMDDVEGNPHRYDFRGWPKGSTQHMRALYFYDLAETRAKHEAQRVKQEEAQANREYAKRVRSQFERAGIGVGHAFDSTAFYFTRADLETLSRIVEEATGKGLI